LEGQNLDNLLIVGAGGHGKVVAEAARAMNRWIKIAFLDDKYESIQKHHNCSVIGGMDSYPKFIDEYQDLFIAVGNNQDRIRHIEKYTNAGFNIPNIIHPTAIVSDTAKICSGTVVLANVVINASVSIGNGSIINTSSSIDHDCVIGDVVHICPGSNLAGNVHVGRLSFIGIGSCIIQGVKVGDEVTIGAGTVVVKDIPAKLKVVGNPARTIS
jgi:sugar O-acyltransferase (sialic acid O-acetyltransferase NeuD family)